MKKIKKGIILLFLIVATTGCEKKLEVDPRQSVDTSVLITDANSAAVAMNGLYSSMQDFYGSTSLIIVDLASDISRHTGTFPRWRDMDENNLFPDGVVVDLWRELYKVIYNANFIITTLPGVDDPGLAVDRDRFIGEASFIRALQYFYLVQLFGEVPLITKPVADLEDVNVAKSAVADIFQLIVSDLQNSVASLPSHGDRTRASKGAANALLAKVFLLQQQWEKAGVAATAAIGDEAGYSLASSYADLFGTQISSEAFLQIPFSTTDANVLAFHYWEKPGGRHEVAPAQDFVDSFDPADQRAGATFGEATGGNSPYFVKKYQDFGTGTDRPYAIRLADILLVKAEAEAALGNFEEAESLVNEVRMRAGLSPVELNTNNFQEVILEERKHELAFEGGNRWLDMLRSGLADQYLQAKGIQVCKKLFPVPRTEIDANTSIVQNLCY